MGVAAARMDLPGADGLACVRSCARVLACTKRGRGRSGTCGVRWTCVHGWACVHGHEYRSQMDLCGWACMDGLVRMGPDLRLRGRACGLACVDVWIQT